MKESAPYLPAGFVQQRLLNPLVSRLGYLPTLAVKGRKSGRWQTVPVRPLELAGATYLVANRGHSHWARNLRAAGAGELRHRGKTTSFRAVEITGDERLHVQAAYLENAHRSIHVLFEQLPDPGDHPTFRIEI